MRLETITEINEYIGKSPVYLVCSSTNEMSTIEIVSEKEFKDPLKNNEFGYVFANQPIGLRKASILTNAVFTEKDEALEFRQYVINHTSVEENPAGYTVGIYIGSPSSSLTMLDPKYFKWQDRYDNAGRSIKLCDIYEQALGQHIIKETDLMTVFHTEPLHGYIYVCGNYKPGDWVLNGETKGYA